MVCTVSEFSLNVFALKMEESQEQLSVIRINDNKHSIVIAGPGSGKTRVIIRRIEFLNNVLGFEPLELLIITYTNRAINEISKRIWNDDFENKYEYKYAGTLHAIAKRMIEEKYIQDFQYLYGKPMQKMFIFDESSVEWFIHVWWKNKYGEENKITSEIFKEIKGYIFNTKYYSYLEKFIPNDYKFKLFGDEKLDFEILKEIFIDYQKNIEERNRLDFLDILIWFHQLLLHVPKIKNECQNKFKHILVDEFQDINRIQLEIIKEISGDNKNIFCVGDPNQAIYGFQGATPNIFDHFQDIYKKEVNVFHLNQNYRSTKNILKFSNISISYNKSKFNNSLWTANPLGEKIEFFVCKDKKEQNSWIIQEINLLIEQGIKPKDIAILYRADYQANTLKKTLYKQGHQLIDYVKTKIISDERARLLICLIVFSYKRDELVSQFIFEYFVKIGDISDEAEEKMIFYKTKNSLSFLELLCNYQNIPNLPEEDKKFLEKIHALIDLNKEKVKGEFSTKEHLSDFFTDFQKSILSINEDINWFSARHEIYKLSADIRLHNGGWKNLEHFFEIAFAYVKHYHCYENNDYLNMSTIHGSKGCEFDYVFILNLSEELLPNHYAIRKDKTNSDLLNNSAIDEERRVFYVALTRTKKKLCISRYIHERKKFSPSIDYDISRFIEELRVEAKEIFNFYKISKFEKKLVKILI